MLTRHAERGASLVEVLVSLLLLSFGLLATAGLHARLVSHQRTAQYRGAAVQLAEDAAERARANPQALPLYEVGGASEPAATAARCAVPDRCTAQELAARDLADWWAMAAGQLPGAGLVVRADPLSPVAAFDVWVFWEPPASAEAGVDGPLHRDCPAPAPVVAQCLHLRSTS